MTWNSNVTNADRSSDVIGALQLHGDLASSTRVALGNDDALFAGANLMVEAWPRFSSLNTAAIGPRLTWQHKFGLGALAPTFGVSLSGDAVAARESDRAGLAGGVTFALRKRFDESTRVALTHELTHNHAHELVYDRTGAETALAVTRDFAEPWSITATARWRQGDVMSYATPPRPDLVTLARERDPSTTFDRPFIVYCVDARTLSGSLALTRTLDDTTALTCGYERRQTDRDSLHYVNHLVSVTFARQF